MLAKRQAKEVFAGYEHVYTDTVASGWVLRMVEAAVRNCAPALRIARTARNTRKGSGT